MNVSDVMTRAVQSCSPEDSLTVPAQIMWENDCGCVPVVSDVTGKTIAMITDRDICMAAYTQGLPLECISVASAASRDLASVREDDDIDTAEARMREHKVRRLPVLDAADALVGVVSLNDLVRYAELGRATDGLSAAAVARTFAAICQPGVVPNDAE